MTMRTAYIGPLISTSGKTGREAKSELRVEPCDPAFGDGLAVGIYGYNSGDEIRTALLTREQAAELAVACQEFIATTPPEEN